LILFELSNLCFAVTHCNRQLELREMLTATQIFEQVTEYLKRAGRERLSVHVTPSKFLLSFYRSRRTNTRVLCSTFSFCLEMSGFSIGWMLRCQCTKNYFTPRRKNEHP